MPRPGKWVLEIMKAVQHPGIHLHSAGVDPFVPSGLVRGIPSAMELMAANLTLAMQNPGNSPSLVLGWRGKTTSLCLQMLQQPVIEDIYLASEFAPCWR